MKNYRLNKNKNSNPNGNNEVHSEDCHLYAILKDFIDLGQHPNCENAVAAAKKLGYPKADGCKHCSLSCHKG
jgi:hypothetical protein